MCGQSQRFLENVSVNVFGMVHVSIVVRPCLAATRRIVLWPTSCLGKEQHGHDDNNDGDTHARFITQSTG